MLRWSKAAWVVVVLVALAARGALAAVGTDHKAEAQRWVDEGSTLYERGEFKAALDRFDRAFLLYPSPKLWFNIGQANRALGRPVEARQALERFLTEAKDASPETRADAQALLAEVERSLGRVRVAGARDGAAVMLDGKLVGTTPLPGSQWVRAGRHVVSATDPAGRSARTEVEVPAGIVQDVELSFASGDVALSASTPAITTNAHRDRGWWLGRRWTWVAGASAVALAAGAVTSGLLMRAKYDDLDKSCGQASPARQGCSTSDLDALNLRRDLANGFWIAAGAAALTTGVLFYVEGRRVTVLPQAGPTVGAQARIEF